MGGFGPALPWTEHWAVPSLTAVGHTGSNLPLLPVSGITSEPQFPHQQKGNSTCFIVRLKYTQYMDTGCLLQTPGFPPLVYLPTYCITACFITCEPHRGPAA